MAATGCLKCLLIFLDVIFGIAGCGLIAIGAIFAWARGLFGDTLSQLSADQGAALPGADLLFKVWDVIAYIILAIGILIFIVSILGCVGAATENKCVLAFYLIPVFLIMLATLALGVMIVIGKQNLDAAGGSTGGADTKADQMEELRTQTLVYDKVAPTYTVLGDAWNRKQFTGYCCGANDYRDYVDSAMTNTTGWIVLPSCCKQLDTASLLDPLSVSTVKDWAKCQQEATTGCTLVSPCVALHDTGCYMPGGNANDEAQKLSQMWITIFYGIMFGFAGLEFLLFLLGILLCCLGRRDYDDSKVV